MEFTLGDVACVIPKWSGTGSGADGSHVELAGRSANLLTRDSEHRWILLLDNPWGTDLFGEPSTS